MKNAKASDLRAEIKYITIGGERLKMVFSNKTYYLVEELYEDEFGRDVGFEKILAEASRGKLRGILALTYCALKCGGNELIPFDEWMSSFDMEDLTTIGGQVVEGVAKTLPETDPKNAGTTEEA